MKRILSLALLSLFAIAISGCATGTNSKPYTPDDLRADVDGVVGTFAAVRLAGHPERRPPWEKAAASLQSLIDNQNWSVSAFVEAFAVSGETSIADERIQLVVQNGVLLVNTLARGRIDMSDPQYARAVIEGALTAIRRVLKTTAPAS